MWLKDEDRRRAMTFAPLVAAALVAALQEPAPTTFDEALRQARAARKLLLVDFSHPW
jgi:hypothetical protein